MADRAVIAFASAIFESDDLLVLALLDDFALTVAPSISGVPCVMLSPSA